MHIVKYTHDHKPTTEADMSDYIPELGSTTEEVEKKRVEYILDMMYINELAENEDYARHNARMHCSKDEQKQVEKLLREIRMNYARISEILAKDRG